jgi:hypothetical protein
MSNIHRTPAIGALLGLTMLSGCAQLNTAYRSRPLPATNPTITTVDAKQRHLLMVPDGPVTTTRTIRTEDGRWEEQITQSPGGGGMRVCAEAAPDVFSAMAASGTLDLSAGAKSPSGGANIGAGFAASETAAAIRRTQTVNLARESFYRTCERYLSGAIGKTAFGVQAARDFRQAIALLAIEQLTGVLQGPSTIISAGSTNAAQTDPEEYYRQLEASSTKLAEAKAKLESAKAAADSEKAPCKAVDGEKTEDKKTREADCTAKTAAMKAAETALKGVQTNQEALLAMGKNGAPMGGITAGTVMGNVTADGGTQAVPNHAAHIAVAVENIARDAMKTDETLMFCLQALAGTDSTFSSATRERVAGTPSVNDTCIDFIKTRVTADALAASQMAQRRVADFRWTTAKLATAIRETKDWPAMLAKIRTIDGAFCLRPAGDFGQSQCATRVETGDELNQMDFNLLEVRLRTIGVLN